MRAKNECERVVDGAGCVLPDGLYYVLAEMRLRRTTQAISSSTKESSPPLTNSTYLMSRSLDPS